MTEQNLDRRHFNVDATTGTVKSGPNPSTTGVSRGYTSLVHTHFNSSRQRGSYHIRTPFKVGAGTPSEMYHFTVKGYAYGNRAIIDAIVVGYAYKYGNIYSPNVSDKSKRATVTQYVGSDKHIYIKVNTANNYYMTLSVESMYVGNGRVVKEDEMVGQFSTTNL